MNILPFEPEHVMGQRVHPSQDEYQWMFDHPEQVGNWQFMASGFFGDDLVVIGGCPKIDGHFVGWLLFSDKILPSRFIGVHRAVLGIMRNLELAGDPVAADINPRRPASVRWARLLGLDSHKLLSTGETLLRMENLVP